MSPTESQTLEQASWLSKPLPGKIESLKEIFTTRMDLLFDGAYFGFNGEAIFVPEFDAKMNAHSMHTQEPSRGKIIAINPGAKRVSRLLPLCREGNSLALLQSRGGYEKLSHIEAESDKLIREVDYEEIFRFIGGDQLVRILRGYGGVITKLEKHIPGIVNTPSSAYQVTKEGQKSGIILVNETHKPNIRPPFFGGGGSLRRRTHATSQ